MAGFLTRIKSASSALPNQTSKDAQAKRKDEAIFEITPLEKMLQNAGPLREDGSDRFFGFENFGNTCYCNSIVQALFYSDLFRQSVINYPFSSPSDTPNGNKPRRPKVNVTLRPPMAPSAPTPLQKQRSASTSQAGKQRQAIGLAQTSAVQGVKPEDKPDTPEYKKKQAMLKGPILELAQENTVAYGMEECTFTGLKDIFLALQESSSRTGVLSPQRFLEIFKRDNEMFRNSMHQDAHEFYGLVLNDVIANVEKNARRCQELESLKGQDDLAQSVRNIVGSAVSNHTSVGYQSPGIGWVHDIFEGVLTSETRCLTCETASQRDETFLDLSIDLEQHASVTSCLRKFSAEEMLCERNKFHCDHCGGLQEAEKRMKVKRLPKILTLHLKRFKYTEDYSRLQKLFHRVVYPYHLRMFDTTDDAADPDRLYELYAVVVHIGGNAYHGHYVSIIKTQDRGWLLFDDEMVEPVDKHFVRNFFGDKPGMATAYVLFYQETTFEKVRKEQEKEGMEEVKLATQAANVAHEDSDKLDSSAPLKRQATHPARPIPETDSMSSLAHVQTAPPGTFTQVSTQQDEIAAGLPTEAPSTPTPAATTTTTTTTTSTTPSTPSTRPTSGLARASTTKQDGLSKEDRKREKKERFAAEKAAKQAEKEKGKQAKAAAKEEEKAKERQIRDAEKRQREELLQRIQARRNEQEELQKVLDASKKSAAQEDEARKRDDGTPSTPTPPVTPPTASGTLAFLERSKRGGRLISRRSFSFFHKDKNSNGNVLMEGTENGDTPDKAGEKTKGRLGIGLGRKKSSNLLS
ncbi:hypothetical protein E4U43_003060 [Claviceps pusilla]|uniref:Ubiquitin carboxyl-terminal hydrolase n=1 Tax=Claviceps pusilla TaxID=123648 RepID=A0A9P7NI12_9HYPO|nr:hypothetical protein E4U43_003060 [Claviceps pusilla]